MCIFIYIYVCISQAGIEEGEQKTSNTIKEIESKGLTIDDAEPAEKEKA